MALKRSSAWKAARAPMTPQPMGCTNTSSSRATTVHTPRRMNTVPAKGLRATVPSSVMKRIAEPWNTRWLSTAMPSPSTRPGATSG